MNKTTNIFHIGSKVTPKGKSHPKGLVLGVALNITNEYIYFIKWHGKDSGAVYQESELTSEGSNRDLVRSKRSFHLGGLVKHRTLSYLKNGVIASIEHGGYILIRWLENNIQCTLKHQPKELIPVSDEEEKVKNNSFILEMKQFDEDLAKREKENLAKIHEDLKQQEEAHREEFEKECKRIDKAFLEAQKTKIRTPLLWTPGNSILTGNIWSQNQLDEACFARYRSSVQKFQTAYGQHLAK